MGKNGENPGKNWRKWEYDENNDVIYKKTSDGYWLNRDDITGRINNKYYDGSEEYPKGKKYYEKYKKIQRVRNMLNENKNRICK